MLPLVLPFSALVRVRVSKALICCIFMQVVWSILACTKASVVPRPEEEHVLVTFKSLFESDTVCRFTLSW